MCKSSKSKLSKEIIPPFLQKSKQINCLNLQKSKQINCRDMIGAVFFRLKFYDIRTIIRSTLLLIVFTPQSSPLSCTTL